MHFEKDPTSGICTVWFRLRRVRECTNVKFREISEQYFLEADCGTSEASEPLVAELMNPRTLQTKLDGLTRPLARQP